MLLMQEPVLCCLQHCRCVHRKYFCNPWGTTFCWVWNPLYCQSLCFILVFFAVGSSVYSMRHRRWCTEDLHDSGHFQKSVSSNIWILAKFLPVAKISCPAGSLWILYWLQYSRCLLIISSSSRKEEALRVFITRPVLITGHNASNFCLGIHNEL